MTPTSAAASRVPTTLRRSANSATAAAARIANCQVSTRAVAKVIALPRHGYSYSQTPVYAGIFLLPLTSGFVVSGPTSGLLSDKFGCCQRSVGSRSAHTPPSRTNATNGTVCAASTTPRSVTEPVRSNTANASATGTSRSPNDDTALPVNSSRNSGRLRTPSRTQAPYEPRHPNRGSTHEGLALLDHSWAATGASRPSAPRTSPGTPWRRSCPRSSATHHHVPIARGRGRRARRGARDVCDRRVGARERSSSWRTDSCSPEAACSGWPRAATPPSAARGASASRAPAPARRLSAP